MKNKKPAMAYHKPECVCEACELVRNQIANAKTTRGNRKAVTVHLTLDEVAEIDQRAEALGVSRKALAENLLRKSLTAV